MTELQANEEIRFIREMIDRTRKITAGSWMFLLFWGVIAILAVAGMYVPVFLEKYTWIWLNWVAFVTVGIVFTMAYGAKLKRRTGVRTYAHIASAHLSIACGVAFVLVGFVFPLLKLYSWGLIAVFIALVAGILVFVMGGIYDWNLLKVCGALWWGGCCGNGSRPRRLQGSFFHSLDSCGIHLAGSRSPFHAQEAESKRCRLINCLPLTQSSIPGPGSLCSRSWLL